MLKKLTVGFALFMAALMAAVVAMPAKAQNGLLDTDIGIRLPGSNMDLGELFVLQELLDDGGGLFDNNGGGLFGGSQSVYIVQSGDTLRGIASRFYGNANLFNVIANANNIANPNVITPGQRLVIPNVSGGGVLGGTDSLSDLFVITRLFSQDRNVSLGDLFIMNRLFDGNGSVLGTNGVITSNGGLFNGRGLFNGGGSTLGELFILDQLFSNGGVQQQQNTQPEPEEDNDNGTTTF